MIPKRHTYVPVPEEYFWGLATKEMKSWSTDVADPHDPDRFRPDVLETALAYAEGQKGDPAPDSIVPSGNGCITMEWTNEEGTRLLEFVDAGSAIFTEIVAGTLRQRLPLAWNPQTRSLQLRD